MFRPDRHTIVQPGHSVTFAAGAHERANLQNASVGRETESATGGGPYQVLDAQTNFVEGLHINIVIL